MASTSEVGVAYVRLLPSMDGFSNDAKGMLSKGLAGPARSAGDDAGRELGKGIGDGVDGSGGRLSGSASKIGDIFKVGLASAGLAAGTALAVGLSSALENEAATDKFVARLGGGEWAGEMGEVAGALYRDAFGDTLADAQAGLDQVLKSGLIPPDAGAEEIEAMTGRFLTFTDVMEKDGERSIRAVSNMLKTGIAKDGTEAFDILTRGIQSGGDQADDLLDSFTEYSVQFAALGLSGADAMGLMLQGVNAGARDADTVADALKELAIRGKDGSTASAEGFRLVGLSADEMTAKFAQGGPAAKEAMGQVLDGLKAIEDPAQRDAAAVALFGTKSEDLQAALGALDLDSAAGGLGEIEGATDGLGSAYDNAATKIESFKRNALHKLTQFVGGVVIPGIEKLVDVIGPALSGVVDAAGPIIDKVVLGFAALRSAFSGEGITSDGFIGMMERIGVTAAGIVNQITLFWNALTTGFTEDEGTPIESIALKLRDFVTFLAETAVPAVQEGVRLLTDAWTQHGPQVTAILGQVVSIIGSALELIIAVVTAAIAVISFIWTNWGDEIMGVITVAWNIISGIISGALDIIQGIIRTVTALIQGDWAGAWEGIKQILSGVWEIIKTVVSGAITAVWEILDLGLAIIAEGFSAAWELIKGIVSLAWDAIVGLFRLQLGIAKNIVTNAWDTIKTIFTDAWNTLTSLVSDGLDDIVDFFRKLPGRIKSALSGLAEAFKKPFRDAFNGIKNLWNSTLGGKGVNIPGFMGFDGISFKIPKLHSGGVFQAPGGGSEGLALLQSGEHVFTEQQVSAMGAAAPIAAGGAKVFIGADGDQYFLRWLRHSVRVEGGGNVQAALGG